MKTIIEPFRIKMVEPLKFTSREERQDILVQAGHNLFKIPAEDVLIDLLTDSGTGAMSSEQWAGVMRGDESYAGAKSFYRLEKTVREITGLPIVLPTHQGRASERILFELLGGPGKIVPSNNHFDTTRANIEHSGATAVDLVISEGRQPQTIHPFKGNMDIARLEALLSEHGRTNIPAVLLTVTNNSGGGQPVSMENIRAVGDLCRRYAIPFFLDACRFAENACFIKRREKEYKDHRVADIVIKMFGHSDGALISAKKDGIANIGGLLLLRDEALAQAARNLLILTEGFPTYGGLAGRDLEAIAQGFKEVIDEDYLNYRLRSTEYVGEKLMGAGVRIVQPAGGHAIYIDARHFLPQIPAKEFPGQSLACELYLAGGIRSCEIGSVMFGGKDKTAEMELLRLAFPRRVYTQSHMDYVIEVIADLFQNRETLRGMRIVRDAPCLRHFSAEFEYIAR